MEEQLDICVNVDICNAGQYFACLGLCELVASLSEGVPLCWFERENSGIFVFRIIGKDSSGNVVNLRDVINLLREVNLIECEFCGKTGPVMLDYPFYIVVDWRESYPYAKLKTWGGKQELFGILNGFKEILPEKEFVNSSIFDYLAVSDYGTTYFDSCTAETSLDVGFSVNNVTRMKKYTKPVLEFLALLGLQRYCPEKVDNHYHYYVWYSPISFMSVPLISLIPNVYKELYSFSVVSRDPEARYKSFSNSYLKKEK